MDVKGTADAVDCVGMDPDARQDRRARRRCPRATGERGTILFEFAVVAPLLLGLVLGLFSGGVAYTDKISIVEAVREGARYGASLPVGSGSGAQTTWETGVQTRVVNALGTSAASTTVCVKLVLPNGGSDCGIVDPPGASSEPTVHLVKVSASRPATLEFVFFQTHPVLRGQLVARFERDTG